MVHPFPGIKETLDKLFKYILCYGSSDEQIVAKFRFHLFKYILCYGSSYGNLMHLLHLCHI